eukprot:1137563-Pelagomonas_calceolata.AAC.5
MPACQQRLDPTLPHLENNPGVGCHHQPPHAPLEFRHPSDLHPHVAPMRHASCVHHVHSVHHLEQLLPRGRAATCALASWALLLPCRAAPPHPGACCPVCWAPKSVAPTTGAGAEAGRRLAMPPDPNRDCTWLP